MPTAGKCFKARYEARGYTVVAPSWPLDDRSPAELRASPTPALAKVGINEIINHYDRLIRALPEPPILIGHSFGGTVTQHLLDRGGVAGVVIDPAPTSGVLVGWQTMQVDLPRVFFLGKLAPRHDHVAQVLQYTLRTDRATSAGRCHVRPLHRPHGRENLLGRSGLSRRQDPLEQTPIARLCCSSAAASTSLPRPR